MDTVEAFEEAAQSFARRVEADATRIESVADEDVDGLRAAGASLLSTVLGDLPLLSLCDAATTVSELPINLAEIDVDAADQTAPILTGWSSLTAVSAGPGGTPPIWAQERDKVDEFFDKIPLPNKERRVVDNMRWTRKMFRHSTEALEGVGEEIDRRDGSGVRKAKRAAAKVKQQAATPPSKPGVLERIGAAIGSFFKSVFG